LGEAAVVWWWWIIPGIVGVLGLALLLGGFGALFRGDGFKGGRGVLGGALFLTIGCAAALMGLNVQTYQRLAYQRPVAMISLRQEGPQHFTATVEEPNGTVRDFDLHGDNWRMEARVLVWKPWANVLGLDSQYRLERLAGSYNDIEQERNAERSVHDLGKAKGVQGNAIDVYSLSKLMRGRLQFVDTLQGSASYMPMANRAEYDVIITQSGLLARPINDEAQGAVTHWDTK
jgi:hypothetical protein